MNADPFGTAGFSHRIKYQSGSSARVYKETERRLK